MAGRSPMVAMMLVRIDQAKAEGRLGSEPALEAALALAAMAQGFVSMHRAGRFSSEKQLRSLYRRAVRRCLESGIEGLRNSYAQAHKLYAA